MPDIFFDLGELYAGQIPVGNDTSKQMFFVYQPKIGEPVDEVTIWFNGVSSWQNYANGCKKTDIVFNRDLAAQVSRAQAPSADVS